MYVNGTTVSTSATTHTIYNPSLAIGIGANSSGSGSFLAGYIDELRITKGVARYASDSGFAVPTAAFPRVQCGAWNPGDKDSFISLSNNNLTASNTPGHLSSVRATTARTTGKYYFEGTLTLVGAAQTGIGISLGGLALGTGIGVTSPTGVCGLNQTGTVYKDGGPLSVVFPGLTNGMVVGVAFDAGSGLVWFREGAAGNWNANAGNNPTTGIGGVSVTGPGPYYPIASFSNFSPEQTTGNFGATSFVGIIPSGFTAWG
jgi:hypothetical protein